MCTFALRPTSICRAVSVLYEPQMIQGVSNIGAMFHTTLPVLQFLRHH